MIKRGPFPQQLSVLAQLEEMSASNLNLSAELGNIERPSVARQRRESSARKVDCVVVQEEVLSRRSILPHHLPIQGEEIPSSRHQHDKVSVVSYSHVARGKRRADPRIFQVPFANSEGASGGPKLAILLVEQKTQTSIVSRRGGRFGRQALTMFGPSLLKV